MLLSSSRMKSVVLLFGLCACAYSFPSSYNEYLLFEPFNKVRFRHWSQIEMYVSWNLFAQNVAITLFQSCVYVPAIANVPQRNVIIFISITRSFVSSYRVVHRFRWISLFNVVMIVTISYQSGMYVWNSKRVTHTSRAYLQKSITSIQTNSLTRKGHQSVMHSIDPLSYQYVSYQYVSFLFQDISGLVLTFFTDLVHAYQWLFVVVTDHLPSIGEDRVLSLSSQVVPTPWCTQNVFMMQWGKAHPLISVARIWLEGGWDHLTTPSTGPQSLQHPIQLWLRV